MRKREAIWCHPDNLDLLRSMVAEFERPQELPGIGPWRLFFGLEIRTSPAVPRRVRRWVPPTGPFWECEESDREWCEPLGLGHWEDTDEPYFVRIAEPDWVSSGFLGSLGISPILLS